MADQGSSLSSFGDDPAAAVSYPTGVSLSETIQALHLDGSSETSRPATTVVDGDSSMSGFSSSDEPGAGPHRKAHHAPEVSAFADLLATADPSLKVSPCCLSFGLPELAGGCVGGGSCCGLRGAAA